MDGNFEKQGRESKTHSSAHADLRMCNYYAMWQMWWVGLWEINHQPLEYLLGINNHRQCLSFKDTKHTKMRGVWSFRIFDSDIRIFSLDIQIYANLCKFMQIYANYMQIAHYVCNYAKMWFWSVSASFKQAQPLWAGPIRQAY